MKILAGVIITFLYLILQLILMRDYGVSWDFHYHHYAGLYHLGKRVPSINEKPEVFFTSPDPRMTVEDPFGPFTQIVPSLSYLIFYEKSGILPFDAAYNLPMVIIGSLGVGLVFLFVYEAIGFIPAVGATIFLALLPNYFGYLHTNMKDIPNAFAFTSSIYTFWRLVKKRRVRDLILASLAFAFAFNVKINSIFLPVICFLWVGILGIKYQISNIKYQKHISKIKSLMIRRDIWIIISYFLLAPITALVVWWPFWSDPLGKLLELPRFYSLNTINIPVLLFGKIYTSGVDIPWWYPYVYIVITTPIPILVSFIVGLFICFRTVLYQISNIKYQRHISNIKNLNISFEICLLILLWFFVPLIRYFNPTSGAIDGMRHFMEVVYPLSFIAGIGGVYIFNLITKLGFRIYLLWTVGVVSFGWLVFINIFYHPYQTSYFNFLVGGIKRANGQFDVDFWGTPQKEAMVWLNKNAAKNVFINILMAQSSASMYLRNDLRANVNLRLPSASDFMVILNRPSFWNQEIRDLLEKGIKEDKVVYSREIDSVPLVWVVRK